MPAVKFIHTADWQLGATFGGYAADLAGELKAARLSVIDRIANIAQKDDITHVLVAGDVWDKEEPAPQTIRQPLDIMGKYPNITWWLMPGNHDPVRADRLWSRIADVAASNIRPLLTAQPVEMSSGVYILPAPWSSKQPGRDLTEDFNQMQTPEGAIRIGLAHGGTTDFSGDAPNSSTIAPNRASLSNLAYLALGDWHGMKQINSRTWYSGTPEPDRFRRNKPGYCLSVTIEDPETTPKVTPHKTAVFDWRMLSYDLQKGGDLKESLSKVFRQATPERHTLIQLSLSGSLSVSERLITLNLVDDISERAAYLQLRDGELETLISPDDLDALDLSGSVRLAAEDLNRRKNSDDLDANGREIASKALDILFTIAGSHDGVSS